jgi:hypothetical protein
MIPTKSVSGIYFPTEITFYSCQLCPPKASDGRKAPYDERKAKEYATLKESSSPYASFDWRQRRILYFKNEWVVDFIRYRRSVGAEICSNLPEKNSHSIAMPLLKSG